jgi:hypothetical protein
MMPPESQHTLSPETSDPAVPGDFETVRLIHRGRSQSQAHIWLVRWQGHLCVLRDYTGDRTPFFRFICQWAIRRELKVHRLLEGAEGIPQLLGIIDHQRYLIEYVEGQPLSDLTKNPPGPKFFARLEEILRGMHRRGVAHGDLRNKNILVRSSDGEPFLVDFSTAWWATSWWRKIFFRAYRFQDLRRLAKSKARMRPDTLSPKEKEILEKQPLYTLFGRFYRHWLYPLIKGR